MIALPPTRWQALFSRRRTALARRLTGRGRRVGAVNLPVVTPPADAAHRRATPELRIDTAAGAPGGELAALAVSNSCLHRALVPPRGAPWEVVEQFALTYDGHAYWSDVAELGSRGLRTWIRHGTVPDCLDRLRGCLFHEQRRWHHFGEEPVGRGAEYVWALLDAIRDRVGTDVSATLSPAASSARHHGAP